MIEEFIKEYEHLKSVEEKYNAICRCFKFSGEPIYAFAVKNGVEISRAITGYNYSASVDIVSLLEAAGFTSEIPFENMKWDITIGEKV
ncbi:MAG: hypothetical protein PHR82_08755 [Endomicrobiaceae bacterium]|nr:hypothetical protein [Endomicrobiaceae bacterium]